MAAAGADRFARSSGAAVALRARLLSAMPGGKLLYIADGIVASDSLGRISWVGDADKYRGPCPALDLRPLLITPGLIDAHAHLPQLPLTGWSGSLTLLPWLEHVMAPAERRFAGSGADVKVAAHRYLATFAAAGTTTVSLYSSVDADATEVAFQAAAEHGIRVILGQCLMDRMRYDDAPEAGITERRLAESAGLCRRWHGVDGGRVSYAFTPRYTLSCTARMLEESARLARELGAYWQTHLAEDMDDVSQSLAAFPGARDYLDIYDRAGGLGPKTILAHGVHISDREIARIIETGTSIIHCPSNVFGGGGILDVGRYRDLGVGLGLASDVGGSTDVSLFKAMELGWVCQAVRGKFTKSRRLIKDLTDWFALATLGGAGALGMADRIGSLEVNKDADLIAIDLERLCVTPVAKLDDPIQMLGLMIFRSRPDMVRCAWVRGRPLAGPGMFDTRGRIGDTPSDVTVHGLASESGLMVPGAHDA